MTIIGFFGPFSLSLILLLPSFLLWVPTYKDGT